MGTAKKIIYYSLVFLGAVGIVNTLGLSLTTNFNLGTLLPGGAGLLLMLYAGLKLRRKDAPIITNALLRRIVCTIVIITVSSFVLVEGVIIYNSHGQDDVRTDFLIILGAGINGDRVSLTLKERLEKGIGYLNKYPGTTVIVSGGQGPGETVTEAEAMRRYLIAAGIEPGRIIMEDKATSTMENFLYSKEILGKEEIRDTGHIMVITNDFHMFRAKMLAKRAGFQPYGIASSTPVPVRVSSFSREYFALIKSLLMDKG